MSPRVRTGLVAVAGLILAILGLFGAARFLRSGEILGSVVVDGHAVALGGLTPDAASEALAAVEAEMEIEPIQVDVVGNEVTVLPQQLGFQLDRETIVAEAMDRGREGDISAQFRWWLGHLFSTDTIEPIGTLQADSVEAVLRTWDVDVIGEPPIPGGVRIEGTTPVPEYPVQGLQVDRSTAADRLLDVALDPSRGPVELGTAPTDSRVTAADVDAAVAQATLWLSSPVELSAGDRSIVFSVNDLARAFTSSVVDGVVVLGFDPDIVGQKLASDRSELEAPPVDAQFEIDGYDVVVVPGQNGTLIDPSATAEALAAAASSVRRHGDLPFEEGAEPAQTTEQLEALGIHHLISQFTTYHPCCQNRVTNIHLMADIIDGAIVMPGDTFGINDYVGERTTERGFLEDGTIIGGELVKTVGGGVSQFATTMYNAEFWAGLEDVTHKPHSFYFSRYPEGIEATVSWKQPELMWRNDTDSAILIRTSYTNTSITVSLYGDNDGRIVVGEQKNGSTHQEIVEEGGPDARKVTATVSGRYNPTEPTTEYRPNPDLAVDETKEIQSPAPGWTVSVTRTITQGGVETTQDWTVRYIAKREIIEVNPCMVPDADVECPPTTTTTSTPDGSSTTTSTTQP